jgi:hypothetical protein
MYYRSILLVVLTKILHYLYQDYLSLPTLLYDCQRIDLCGLLRLDIFG